MKFFASSIAAILAAGSAAAGGYNAPVVEVAPVAEVVVPVAVEADWTGFYGGLQYGKGEAEADVDGAEAVDFDAFGLHAGYLRDMGKVVVGGELDYNRVDVEDADQSDLVRLRARVGADLGRFMPYATLGIARLSDDDLSETGFTYGIGAEFKATEKFSLGLEYTKNDFDDVDGTGIDLGVDMVQVRASYHF